MLNLTQLHVPLIPFQLLYICDSLFIFQRQSHWLRGCLPTGFSPPFVIKVLPAFLLSYFLNSSTQCCIVGWSRWSSKVPILPLLAIYSKTCIYVLRNIPRIIFPTSSFIFSWVILLSMWGFQKVHFFPDHIKTMRWWTAFSSGVFIFQNSQCVEYFVNYEALPQRLEITRSQLARDWFLSFHFTEPTELIYLLKVCPRILPCVHILSMLHQ